MKKEYFFQRHWAETVRLYSGLLSGEERINFIKYIAEENILLAAECRSISIVPEEDLDNYLAKIARTKAKYFKQTETSAKGIMALVELNKFDEITQIFSSLSGSQRNPLYNEVVSNYIANGSELQIATFMVVLSYSNKELLERAIDRTFPLNIFFSDASIVQLKGIISRLIEEKEEKIAAKMMCIIPKMSANIDVAKYLEILLRYMEISYTEKLIKLYKFKPVIDTYGYLSIFVNNGLIKDSLVKFLTICKRSKSDYDLKKIRVELSKHLNPRMKSLVFYYEPEISISPDTAYDMYLENVRIGNVSSIEFALELVDKFKLQGKVGIEFIIENLLSTPKVRRLELAYQLIKKHSLESKFSYQTIFDYAINSSNHESIALAKIIILNEFEKDNIQESLLKLCCIAVNSLKSTKIARDIIFSNIQNIEL